MTQEWITTAEAARISGYTSYHVRYLLTSGKVKARKFGQVWQIDQVSLSAYIRSIGKIGAKRGPKTSV